MPNSSKIERQGNLVALLLRVSAPISFERIQQSISGYLGPKDSKRKVFERDKAELKKKGIHIRIGDDRSYENPREGYLIEQREYFLEAAGLTQNELLALAVARELIHFDKIGIDYSIYKLGGNLPSLQKSSLGLLLPDPAPLVPFLTAMRESKAVEFKYKSEKGETTSRELEPREYFPYESRWHIRGYDRLRSDIRNFRLDRIQGTVRLQAEPSEFRSQPEGQLLISKPWDLGLEPQQIAVLWVNQAQADWALELIGEALDVKPKNEGMEFTLSVTSTKHFFRLILRFGENAEILGPPKLRQDFTAYLKEIADA